MEEVSQSYFCSDCRTALPVLSAVKENQPNSCPNCGSTKRTINVEIFDSVSLSIHDNVKGKLRDGPGKKGIKKEFFVGDDYRKSKDDWVDKERVIDRENNRYLETVR